MFQLFNTVRSIEIFENHNAKEHFHSDFIAFYRSALYINKWLFYRVTVSFNA